MTTPMTANRYSWLDYLRGIAAIWMIEVHVTDIALASNWHSAWWYPWLNLSHGFVAVAFLFCAGGAFALTLERKVAAYRQLARPLWEYLGKLALLLVIGYWLHLPAFSLERTLQASAEELRRLADCDILQTIAYSSLAALGIGMLIHSERWRFGIYAALSVVFAVLTPWIWQTQLYEQLPLFLGALIAPPPQSKFPLFPFAAYFFAGAWIVPLLRNLTTTALSSIGIACLLTAGGTMTIGLASPASWWYSSPLHVLFRLSGTVCTLVVLILAEPVMQRFRWRKILLIAGQQSLWIYVFHLLIVYGSVGGKGLATMVDNQLSYPGAFLVFIGVGAVSLASAWGWSVLKDIMPQVVRTTVAAAVGIGILTFLFLPARYAELLTTVESVQHAGERPGVERSDLPRLAALLVQDLVATESSLDREMCAAYSPTMDLHKFLP
ncbi:MAG: acyltransferase [Bacteroidota bacterium]|nr:DUF1624 domain-containing protein [Candidatus Kapabacteria bacterium]MDW8074979.1 acyltransferase [Bacteroidota bacterium]MDW8271618.1 acyltransferase [Bacteroidota bacterium]